MNPSKILFLILTIAILLPNVNATKVFFYEDKVSGNYKVDSEYSDFKDELEKNGYNVVRAEIPLSDKVIEGYSPDILVIPDLSSELTSTELAVVSKFVIKDGGGLFLIGDSPTMNQITPFGLVIDDSKLEDSTDPIIDASTRQPSTNKKEFVIKAPFTREDPTTRIILDRVYEIGFFEGSGIYLSGDAEAILTGDWDTSTGTGSFPPGSRPPVAVAARVGNGLVFLLSDPDVLENSKLDSTKYKYDNLRLGINIIDWLALASEVPENTTLQDLWTTMNELKEEKKRLNETLQDVIRERDSLRTKTRDQSAQVDSLLAEIENLKNSLFLQGWAITYSTILIALILIILLSAYVAIVRRGKKIAPKEEEEIGELGFEFEDEEEPGVPEGEEELDIPEEVEKGDLGDIIEIGSEEGLEKETEKPETEKK